jgi:hypothetical protein
MSFGNYNADAFWSEEVGTCKQKNSQSNKTNIYLFGKIVIFCFPKKSNISFS